VSRPAFASRLVAPLPLEEGQLRFEPEQLKAEGCDRVELHGGKVAALWAPDRRALQHRLSEAGLTAAFITSEGEGWTLDALQEAFALCGAFEAEGVVVNAPPSRVDQPAAAAWLDAAVALAEANALPLLIENRPGTWAGTSREFNRFIGQTDSPWLQVAFDPAGFAALREHPFLTAFMSGRLKSRLQLLRIRDAAFEDGRSVRVNEGNAEVAELVSAALARSYPGFFSVGHSHGTFEEIRVALEDFGRLLAELGLENSVP
jgi:sugar phosphate isomerase/epimerase